MKELGADAAEQDKERSRQLIEWYSEQHSQFAYKAVVETDDGLVGWVHSYMIMLEDDKSLPVDLESNIIHMLYKFNVKALSFEDEPLNNTGYFQNQLKPANIELERQISDMF
jgi:hypothetical protein